MTEDITGPFGDSRRSFMKKGALAATALAVGTGATAGTTAAQENGNEEVHVYGDDYRPGVDFTVVAELSTSTLNDVVEESGSEDDVFDDPDDWDGYVINYDLGVDAPTWGLLFAENGEVSVGDTNTMGEDGDFRDAEIDLIEVTLGETAEEEPEEEEEEEEIEEEEEEPEEEEEEDEIDPDADPGVDDE